MTCMIKQQIRRFGMTGYVRSAIEEQADLSAFKEKPTFRILAGVFAISFSFVLGWPTIALLGFLSLRLGSVWIAAVGGPLAYALSHLVFMLGMYLSGTVYSLIFLRWLTRICMERLLAWAAED